MSIMTCVQYLKLNTTLILAGGIVQYQFWDHKTKARKKEIRMTKNT